MKLPNLLKKDLEHPRSANELYQWVQKVHDEFGATAEGKTIIRMRSEPYVKQFLEEIWPLANYAWLFFRDCDDVRFQPIIGNQQYDALLLDNFGSTLCQFEITEALYGEAGYQDRLRREHLDDYGHAPLTGPNLVRDPKSKGVQESAGEATEHTGAIDKTLRQIRTAIVAKASKTYAPNTRLIVEFQGVHFQRSCAQSVLDGLAKSEFCDIARQFSELALIDEIARFGFRYPTGCGPSA